MVVRKMDERLLLGLHEDFMKKHESDVTAYHNFVCYLSFCCSYFEVVHLMLKSCRVEIDVQHIL